LNDDVDGGEMLVMWALKVLNAEECRSFGVFEFLMMMTVIFFTIISYIFSV
jgi:hypothetical protein